MCRSILGRFRVGSFIRKGVWGPDNVLPHHVADSVDTYRHDFPQRSQDKKKKKCKSRDRSSLFPPLDKKNKSPTETHNYELKCQTCDFLTLITFLKLWPFITYLWPKKPPKNQQQICDFYLTHDYIVKTRNNDLEIGRAYLAKQLLQLLVFSTRDGVKVDRGGLTTNTICLMHTCTFTVD